MTGEPSDLWDRLDQMERAEPLDPEEDLVLRMQAVSKLRGHASGKEKRQEKSKERGFAASRLIGKNRRQPRGGKAAEKGVTFDASTRVSAVAAAAALAVTRERRESMEDVIPPPLKLKRSHSI